MTARQQRRHEEHKARKDAYKAQKQAQKQAEQETGKMAELPAASRSMPEPPVMSALSHSRTEINRANAQHSTGPKTSVGKTTSSKNAIRHGLASDRFALLEWERFEDFEELLANLRAEHRPATQTEALLVEKMAQHFWLSQRALRLQDLCFHPDTPMCDQPQEMALYLRYGATHDRAFHHCLTQLQKLRAEQRKVENGFISQKRQQAAETRNQELHQVKLRAIAAPKKPQKLELKTYAPAVGSEPNPQVAHIAGKCYVAEAATAA